MILFILATLSSQFIVSSATDEEISRNLSPSTSCRTEKRFSMPLDKYRSDTCARCYNYLPNTAFVNINLKFKYDSHFGTLTDPRTNRSYYIDTDNTSHPIFDTFSSKALLLKWVSCCQAAVACCRKMSNDPLPPGNLLHCPRTWDGWQCWPDTPAGDTAIQACQEHVYFSSEPPFCLRYATKICTQNFTWFLHEKYKIEWTNYTGCGRIGGLLRRQYFHITTYSVSIFFLIPAIFIFTVYKQLHVYRISMHRNLFASLLLNGIFVIVFKSVVMLDELESFDNRTSILDENGPGCKFLFILTKYFRMTNYMWMFCEGLYLQRLIASAFAEQKNLILFYLTGWVFPVVPILIYVILRQLFANEQCWVVPAGSFEWILNGPNLLSLLLNFTFLCYIIQVLVTKLKATHANEPSQYRKAVRATLVLVPLFGLHFFLVIYRPQFGECDVLEAYTLFSHALDGLQGFLVSLIFCYFNGEILYLLKRSYKRYKLQQICVKRRQTRLGLSRRSISTKTPTLVDRPLRANRRVTRQSGAIRSTAC